MGNGSFQCDLDDGRSHSELFALLHGMSQDDVP